MKAYFWVTTLALCGASCKGGARSIGDPDCGSPRQASDAAANQAAALDAGADEQDADSLVWTPSQQAPRGPVVEQDPTLRDERACAEPRQPLQAVLLPRCQASTRSCIDGCQAQAEQADACREACLQADDFPPHPQSGLSCATCVYLQLFACIADAGCQEGVAAFFCCTQARCPAGSPEGCGEARCGNELRAALTCGYYADQDCLDLAGGLSSQCYAEGDSDGGV